MTPEVKVSGKMLIFDAPIGTTKKAHIKVFGEESRQIHYEDTVQVKTDAAGTVTLPFPVDTEKRAIIEAVAVEVLCLNENDQPCSDVGRAINVKLQPPNPAPAPTPAPTPTPKPTPTPTPPNGGGKNGPSKLKWPKISIWLIVVVISIVSLATFIVWGLPRMKKAWSEWSSEMWPVTRPVTGPENTNTHAGVKSAKVATPREKVATPPQITSVVNITNITNLNEVIGTMSETTAASQSNKVIFVNGSHNVVFANSAPVTYNSFAGNGVNGGDADLESALRSRSSTSNWNQPGKSGNKCIVVRIPEELTNCWSVTLQPGGSAMFIMEEGWAIKVFGPNNLTNLSVQAVSREGKHIEVKPGSSLENLRHATLYLCRQAKQSVTVDVVPYRP